MKNIAILGSTGSIGTQTLDVARKNEDLRVVAVSAGKSVEKLELAVNQEEEKTNFLKTILFFSISEAIPCDSLFTIPLPQGIVKHFFTNFLHFFITLFSRSFFFNH